jgi:hypothetical protein
MFRRRERDPEVEVTERAVKDCLKELADQRRAR